VKPIDDRRELWLVMAILLLATILRVGWPTLTEFKFSEARLEALALELTREGRLPLLGVPSSAGFDHSPISVYLYIPAFLFTANPIPATIFGGLVNVAAVALCWWLARRWAGGGRWAALVSALLFAVSPWAVVFSRKIWQVAFVPLLTLAFVGFMVSALVEEPVLRSSQARKWHLSLALVLYALLVQVHPSAVSLALAILLWLIVFWRKVKVGPLLAGAVGGALTAIPFLVHQLQSGWPVLTALRGLPDAVWDLSAAWLAWGAITGQGVHSLAGRSYPLLKGVPALESGFHLLGGFAMLGALGLAWRTVACWRGEDSEHGHPARIDLILLSWLVIPVAFNMRHSLELHLHFFAIVMPAAYLVIGRAAEGIFRRSRPTLLRTAAVVGIGLLALAQVLALVLLGHFVATHDTAGGFGTPLAHYLAIADETVSTVQHTAASEILVVGQGDSPVADETPAIFDVLLRERATYRFVDGESAALFPPHPAVALLSSGVGEATNWYEPWPAQDLPYDARLILLDGRWPQEGFEAISSPRVFQNGIEFQGYHWEKGAGPDGEGQFWLLWQPLWLSTDDTHFFVHLLDDSGQLQGQKDTEGYPTAYRNKGDRVISKFDITFSQGVTAIPEWARVGLYKYPEVANLLVIDEAGNPVTDAVVVGPLHEGP
jgi:hypothetical protein